MLLISARRLPNLKFKETLHSSRDGRIILHKVTAHNVYADAHFPLLLLYHLFKTCTYEVERDPAAEVVAAGSLRVKTETGNYDAFL